MTNQLFPFELSDEDSLIQIDFWFQKDKLTFAVDTGASHTVIDLAPLLIAGYELKDAIGMVELETGKGIIEAYIFRIPRITALGITLYNFFSYFANKNHVNDDRRKEKTPTQSPAHAPSRTRRHNDHRKRHTQLFPCL